MKKLLTYLSVAMLGMAAVACQEEIGVATPGDGNVTITLQTPGVATKAIADGENVDIVYYEIYHAETGHKNSLTGNAGPLIKNTIEMNGKEATLNLNLLQGQQYVGLFWAQVDGNDYYNLGDLRNVQVNYPNEEGNKTAANDEARAAFCQVQQFATGENVTVTLERPFAQINLGTSFHSLDIDYEINLEESSMTVYAVANSFNVAAMTAGTTTVDVVFDLATVPYAFEEPEVLEANGDTWAYAGMNYVLVPGDAANVNLSYAIKTDVGTVSRAVPSVPVKKNYRTNLLGNLLTQETVIEIVVDENFADEDLDGGKFGVIDGQKYVKVEDAAEFNAAFTDENVDIIILANDVVLSETLTRSTTDYTLTVSAGKTLTIDLNGKKLSATSTQTGKNYNMFDVRGTLTVKNGNMEYQHLGENMGWNNYAEIFYVGVNGTLNLDGVAAKNFGGSDMAYIIDMCNATNINVNVENSTLESTYIPVRVFNNSKTGVNNVTIKNSTLKGKYCFWVQYWLADGRDEASLENTLKLDIFNGTNSFEATGKAPVIYGFDETLYFDATGSEIVFDAETLAARLTAGAENISVVLGADIDLPISSLGQQTGGSGEYKLGGENTQAITVDLNGKYLNVTTTYWSVLGAKNADALFTIKNGTMTSSQASGTWNSYDLCFANCNYVFEDVVFDKAIALESAGKNFTLKNVTINETHDYYAMWISAKGQNVTVDGLTINSDGRAIKIDEQYVNEPAKVILNVSNSTFKSVKKAAIVVKSVAGAEINVDNLDITAVAADTEFAVWVDENSKAYADLVVVTGAYCKVEGENTVIVTNVDELNAAMTAGAVVYLAGQFDYIVAKSNVTLVGTPEAVVGCINLNGAENLTLRGIQFDAAKAKIGCDGAGKSKQYANIITGESTVKPLVGAHNLVIDGCKFNGTFANGGAAIAFTDQNRKSGGSGNVTIKNCTFNTTGSYYHIYGHYTGDSQNGFADFAIENNDFKSASQGKPVYLGRYASSAPVVVKGNAFETVANLDAAVYVQDHSNYGVSVNAENNTFAN